MKFSADCGDHVIVINSADIAMRGNEWVKRVYFHHTTYAGGATWTLAWELHKKDPTMVMRKAVYAELPTQVQRRHTMQRLHIFKNDKVPKELLANVSNQLPGVQPVPVRLDQIPKEVVDAYPRIVKLPMNYIPKGGI